MQKYNFSSPVELLAYLPSEEREITSCLRELVHETIPGIKEKLSYNVPLYKLNKTICSIWPSSILWGKEKTYSGVRMGFWYGYKLVQNSAFITLGDRKIIAHHDFLSLEDIEQNHHEIQRLLLESKLLDMIG